MVAFRPRRRAFSSRPRPLLSGANWLSAAVGAVFGGAVTAGLMGGTLPADLAPLALVQPPPVSVADVYPTPQPIAEEARGALPANFDNAPVDQPAAPAVSNFEPAPADAPVSLPALTGRAARIVDGDTFYLEGFETRLRVWGIDAPEKNQPGFAEATQALQSLVEGRTLACEEMDRDRYERIVARCTLDDGRDIGRVMIEIGAATEMVRYSGGYYGG